MPTQSLLIFLGVVIFSGIGSVGADCQDNWRRFDGNCYLFLTHFPMNWQSAWDYCAHRGAKLAEIESALEDSLMIQNAKDFHFHDFHNCFWLGGSDAELPGLWLWSTSRNMFTYTNWGPGEPNYRHNDTEHCLSLYYYSTYSTYYWNDEPCTTHCYPICEQPNAWPVYTDSSYVTPTTRTTRTSTTTTSSTTTTTTTVPQTSTTTTTTTVPQTSTTTTTTTVPQTTKPLQMVTLPRNPQNSQYTDCPSGWVRFASSCYLFATDIAYDWVESGHFCTLFGASLTSIETEIENNFIRQHLLNIAKPVDFWVGGTDIVKEGDWRWMTSQKQITYSDWYPGKPSDFHHNMNCLELLHNYKYHWNDQDCNVVNHFICEIPNGPQPHIIFGKKRMLLFSKSFIHVPHLRK